MKMETADAKIPPMLRWGTYAVERIGFPIFACAAMFYLGERSMQQMTIALDQVSRTLTEFREQVRQDHATMLRQLELTAKPK
jgi:hypothetical protein